MSAYQLSVVLDTGQKDALVDEVIRIHVLGLAPRAQITIHSRLEEKGHTFGSTACFNADNDGVVDVSKHPSVRGTYTGVHPMGLFWSMIPAPGEPTGLRLFKRDASTPLTTTISVYTGHIDFEELASANIIPVVSNTVNRWYMGKGVQRVTVKHGRIRGAVFIPPGEGPFPGVIDMFGIAGSLAEFRAALLASRGIAAYALPYFSYDDLPSVLEVIDFEYFMEAVDWLASQPYVGRYGIGVIGVSKGGEIALQMAYYSTKIRAVVSINGAPFLSTLPMVYQGNYIGISRTDISKIRVTHEGNIYRDIYICEPTNIFPLYQRDVHALLIVGEDDMAMNPRYLIDFYTSYPQDRRHLMEFCLYSGAGHLIEPPYAPNARSTRATGAVKGLTGNIGAVLWGGNPVDHARAQEQSWSKILEFFRSKLNVKTITITGKL